MFDESHHGAHTAMVWQSTLPEFVGIWSWVGTEGLGVVIN